MTLIGRLSLLVCVLVGCAGACVERGDRERVSSASVDAEIPVTVLTDGLLAHRPAVPGVQGLVAAGHPLASMAGMRVLMQGGTAADAAVTVMGTLASVEPMASGVGGGVVLTVYDAETNGVYTLNATGVAAARLGTAEPDAASLYRGVRAGVVPGLVGAWIELLERFGVMTLGQALQPAIEYAEQGHPLTAPAVAAMAAAPELFERYPTTAAVFMPDGELPEVGHPVSYPDLARTLHKLVEAEETSRINGADRQAGLRAAFTRFYRGDMARDMVRFLDREEGLLTRGDFAGYQPEWTEPATTTYRGYEIHGPAAPARGGVEVLLALDVLEGFDLASMEPGSADVLHLIIEAVKIAKADAHGFVADPGEVEVPPGLISKAFADVRRRLISPDEAMVFPAPGSLAEGEPEARASGGRRLDEMSAPGGTASLSVFDRWGNIVVANPTLGSRWGTGVVVGNTGLILQNGMRIGAAAPDPDHPGYPRGGRVPVVNGAPTLVLNEGQVVLALAGQEGRSVGPAVLQTIVNVIDFGMGIQEAIEAPRVSLRATPSFFEEGVAVTVQLEDRMPDSVLNRLAALGHEVELLPGYGIGNVQGMFRRSDSDVMVAGADPRQTMYAVGW